MADLASASQDIPLADEGATHQPPSKFAGEIINPRDDGCPTISDYAAQRVRPAEPLPRPADEEDEEEKARLIANVLELQNTLDDLSQRVDSVKEESIKLRQENQVLGQYIHNLMAASSIFQSATPKSTNNNEMLSSYFW